MRQPQPGSGIALVAVLWVILLLSVIAASFGLSTRTSIQLSNHVLHQARAAGLIEAAISRTIVELSKPDSSQIWTRDGGIQTWAFGGAAILIAIQDARGLIDLNQGDKSSMKKLIEGFEIASEDAAKISDAIIDWRDSNKFAQLNGAEDSDYESAGLPYRSKDAPFDTVEELRLVLGVTHEVYQKLAPFVTVHSKSKNVNSEVAPPEVLLALPGFDQQRVDEIRRLREEQADSRREGVEGVGGFGGNSSRPGDGQAFHVRIQVQFQNGLVYTNEVVLTKGNFSSIPYRISAWKPGFLFPEQSEEEEEGSL